MSKDSLGKTLDFFSILESLKTTKRTGWVRHGISGPESISDHMHRMSLLAMLIPLTSSDTFPAVNQSKLIQMALVHDVAEATVGDITPNCGISNEEKHSRERQAMETFVELLNRSQQAQSMKALWEEYEEGKTPEAILCKDLDKFEMIQQAFEYEQREKTPLHDFFISTKGKFRHPTVQSWAQGLYEKRQSLLGHKLE